MPFGRPFGHVAGDIFMPDAEASAGGGDSAVLLARLAAGDDTAADPIVQRYFARLARLAQTRLCAKLAGRVDPEDIVQSAYRSFFVHAREGQFAVSRGGDLWRLLASITLHKVYRQHARHTAARRDVYRELPGPIGQDPRPESNLACDRQPSPAAASALADELERCLADLTPLERRVLELRLQGQALDEIASAIGRTERTVRRALQSVRERLEHRLTS
jgi:RNA polymerase sigma factor (sigma-70 family)